MSEEYENDEQEQTPVPVKIVAISELDKEWVEDFIEKVIEARAAYVMRLIFMTIGWLLLVVGFVFALISVLAGAQKIAPLLLGVLGIVAGICLVVGFWKTKRKS